MDNLTACNPVAHRVRVYYTGSNTIYEGMALCYDYDTTTNWFGGSVSNGEVTASSTTSAGTMNEGKYIRVEEPSSDNKIAFAGVVAAGGWCGKTGPRVLDVYVPNGAIVPVYTDKSIVARDKLYLEDGENTLVNAVQVGMLDCVGIATETKDRSSTAGLVQAKLFATKDQGVVPGTLGIGPSELLWLDCPEEEIRTNPGMGIYYFDDFLGQIDVTTGDGWTLTQVDSKGSISREAGAAGGVLQVTSATGDSADDGINAQLTNCAFLPASTTTIWFEARIKVSDATQQWALGLSAVDTTVIAAGIFDDTVDKVLFGHLAASTDNKIVAINARTSAEDAHADIADITDDTWTTVGFRITGGTDIEYYVDGVKITGLTVTDARIPNAAMCLTAVSQYESADNILSVDWVKIVALGGRDA